MHVCAAHKGKYSQSIKYWKIYEDMHAYTLASVCVAALRRNKIQMN